MLLLRLLFLGISSLIGFQLQLLIEISSLHVSLSLRFSRFIELLLDVEQFVEVGDLGPLLFLLVILLAGV
mgnify:FL=1